jgi:hypothetical protein
MAPSIPTYRPLFTATRITAAVAVASTISSLLLVLYAPAEAAAEPGTVIACAATVGGVR